MKNNEYQSTGTPMYLVVLSEEGHAAVWPCARSLPVGWTVTDMTGSREECLAYIKLVGDDPVLRRRAAAPAVVA